MSRSTGPLSNAMFNKNMTLNMKQIHLSLQFSFPDILYKNLFPKTLNIWQGHLILHPILASQGFFSPITPFFKLYNQIG
jgi:hypothetical protein